MNGYGRVEFLVSSCCKDKYEVFVDIKALVVVLENGIVESFCNILCGKIVDFFQIVLFDFFLGVVII